MKINKKNIMLLSGLLLTACVTNSTTDSSLLKMPEPDAEALWKYISQENSFTEWAVWENGKGLNDDAGTASYSPNHKVYLNSQAVELRKTIIPYPNESILVSYIRSPAGEPKAVTVMYKVKGYNPAAGDWFWAKYSLTGEVEEAGKVKRCISCHAKKIPGNDYIASTSLKGKKGNTFISKKRKKGTPSSTPAATETPGSASVGTVGTGKPSLDPAAMLAAHNQWRSKTGVPALQWSNELAGSSQKWADQLARTGCNMKHSTGKYGENIFWAGAATRSDGTSSVQNISDQNVVDAWGNEIQDYDYASNSCHGVCGHYTQVVWKSTSDVGCAMTVCSDKAQLWVCQYTSRGNMVGEKPY